jgi:hypothetical protein
MYFCTWSAGGYDKEDKAARAYDLAALKYWGSSTTINFPVPPLPLCHTESHILLLQYELMGLCHRYGHVFEATSSLTIFLL